MTDPNQALRQIEGALIDAQIFLNHQCGASEVSRTMVVVKINEALASLRSLLEGDAGEDEKILLDLMNLGKELIETDPQQKTEAGQKIKAMFEMGKPIVHSLSAKAKIGELLRGDNKTLNDLILKMNEEHEAEIREAKREVFKEIWGQWIALGNLPEFIEWLHEQLAALDREAGK